VTLGDGVTNEVRELLESTAAEIPGSPYAARLNDLVERIDGPLRVAIAGRIKAGKSTLLNALVGERLAPTDAGECTKVVSWFRHASGYQVAAQLVDGSERTLAFKRDRGALDIELGALTERDIRSIQIGWPAKSLIELTLIDTPGLASINDENSRRTRDFLEVESDLTPEADAVIYLMRHMHRSDMEFLDAFMDRSVSAASPVNAVAVLSRADEIGACRLDAMESATRIANRYRQDPNVQSLAATVVPVAGLLAETGLTLREDEVAALRTLVATEATALELMLLSAEHFCELHASDLTVEIRRDLIDRFGIFGLRVAVQEVANGATTAAALAPRLVDHSGLGELRKLIAEHFLPRARLLKARSALVSARMLVPELRAVHAGAADRLERGAEKIDASAIEFARLRAAHLVSSAGLRFADGEKGDLERLLLGATTRDTLGLSSQSGSEQVKRVALEAVARWRGRASDPLAEPALIEVYEIAARTSESIYASN
jgi:hypothetical protein